MLKVGLTGGIACGKTTVLEMFAARGAHTLRADELAHQMMMPGQSVYQEVVSHFGTDILNPDGTINRPRLSAKAFAGRIEELNAIVHPAVIAAQDDWATQIGVREPHAIVIIEAALMVEAGAHKHLGKLIVVTCNAEQKAKRYAQRTGISVEDARAEVERRMKSQLDDAAKIEVADYVIDNSGSIAEAEAQVGRVWNQLVAVEANTVQPN